MPKTQQNNNLLQIKLALMPLLKQRFVLVLQAPLQSIALMYAPNIAVERDAPQAALPLTFTLGIPQCATSFSNFYIQLPLLT